MMLPATIQPHDPAAALLDQGPAFVFPTADQGSLARLQARAPAAQPEGGGFSAARHRLKFAKKGGFVDTFEFKPARSTQADGLSVTRA